MSEPGPSWRRRVRAAAQALATLSGSKDLRRLQLGLVGSEMGNWAYSVALAIYAFDRGGAGLVGLAGFIRFLPAAVLAPFAGVIADRYPRRRVLLVCELLRAALLGGVAALVAAGAPAGTVLALVALASIVATVFVPAKSALTPALTDTPEQLTAANVAGSTIESVGSFLGPALGGLLLVASSVQVVFLATAGALLWSAALVSRIRADEPPRPSSDERAGFRSEIAAGARAIAEDRDLRVFVALFTTQTLVAGALTVLVVIMALDLAHLGRSGVGLLNGMIGIGGLVGAGVGLALVGRRGLAFQFAVGLLLWGLPLVLVGAWSAPIVVFAAMALIGVGNTLVDVAGYTLLQRSVADDVLARAFGILESLIVGSVAIGALIAPLLVHGLGNHGALVAVGALLPALTLLAWRRLQRIDAAAAAPTRGLELLRGLDLFAPLPQPALEQLAGRLEPQHVAEGETVFAQGDPGDRFYVIDSGAVEVLVDGRKARRQGPGEAFGEIALLRSVPRTAAVVAEEDTALLWLESDVFIAAVTGHAPASRAADAVIAARLSHARPTVGGP
ncbi:MAG: transporter [Solirubrobacterales bacterium]|nr:transporter [Solirubrobacterales bacterium]